jgi:hypothetical protein
LFENQIFAICPSFVDHQKCSAAAIPIIAADSLTSNCEHGSPVVRLNENCVPYALAVIRKSRAIGGQDQYFVVIK